MNKCYYSEARELGLMPGNLLSAWQHSPRE